MRKFTTAFFLILSVVAVGCSSSGSAKGSGIVFTPGTYQGSTMGRNGPMSVEVTVDASSIVAVRVVKHSETKSIGDVPIELVPRRIVAEQSLMVDSVTGATLTSRAIIAGAKAALENTGSDISPFLTVRPKTGKRTPQNAATDVVVIGAGNAGMTAAVELAKAGFKIILVEKQGLLGGGDSMLQSTSTNAGGSRMISQLGIQNAGTEDFYNWLQNTADTKGIDIDRDSTRTYAMRSGEIIDWLIDLGVDYGRFGRDNFSHYIRDGSAPGINIMPAIGAEIERLNVDYRLNTRAEKILMDNGRAVGVEVTGPDGKYSITARAVMIATGGYSNNQDLVAKYCPQWSNRPTTGARSLTGDGIFMAEAAGAAIYNMDVVKANYLCHVIASGDGVSLTALTPYVILVNHDGKRFVNEGHASINHKSEEMMKQPNHEAYVVFDQQALDELALMRGYNEAGYFVSSDTVQGLAEQLDVNTTNFVKTVNDFIEYCKTGVDPEFGRNTKYPLGGHRFYATVVTPAMQSTYGGIKVNTKAQVISTSGAVIPGLYAAGATSGHGCFANEVGAAGIIALTYGKIAGETMVADLRGNL